MNDHSIKQANSGNSDNLLLELPLLHARQYSLRNLSTDSEPFSGCVSAVQPAIEGGV